MSPHHVHAYASSGDVGHFFGGAEAGLEDQVVVSLSERAVIRLDQPSLDRLGADLVAIQPPAVIGDFDHHLARLVVGFEVDVGQGRLTALLSFLRTLNSMIEGVANHVHQGIGEFFDNGAVQFDFVTAGFQLDALTELARKVANQACHFAEQGTDGNQAHGHRSSSAIPR